jgi:hypothetical protein
MNQLEFKPAVDFEQYKKLPFEKSLSVDLLKRGSKNYDASLNSKDESEIQEKQPIGMETGMVYIAIPVSIAVWVGIIYFVKIMFF